MKQIFITVITLGASIMVAAAQSAKEPYNPGLGEFMTATQLRHAKLWFAGKDSNWDLAAYEIDEIKEGLEDAARLHPNFDGVPVADMIKSIINPRIEDLKGRLQQGASPSLSSPSTNLLAVAIAATRQPTIHIQRPTAPPLTNQNFSPAR